MGTLDRSDWPGLAATARSAPLDRVAMALGCRRDVTDKARWKRPGSVPVINGERHFDHLAGTGGGGAISLAMHADGVGFRDAVGFLSAQGFRSCNLRDGAAPPAGRRRLELPARSRALWPEVRDRPVRERGIGGMPLRVCHARGPACADCRRNAVFVSRNVSGAAAGAGIAGLGSRGGAAAFKGMAPGSRKASGGFWMAWDTVPPEQAVLVESAIDALSVPALRSFPSAGCGGGLAAVSVAGVAASVPRWLDGWRLRRILCGCDADRAGDAAAAGLVRSDPRVVRCRPAVEGEDWNGLLVREMMGEPAWSGRPEDEACRFPPP